MSADKREHVMGYKCPSCGTVGGHTRTRFGPPGDGRNLERYCRSCNKRFLTNDAEFVNRIEQDEPVFDLSDEDVLRLTNESEELTLDTGNQKIRIRTSDYYIKNEETRNGDTSFTDKDSVEAEPCSSPNGMKKRPEDADDNPELPTVGFEGQERDPTEPGESHTALAQDPELLDGWGETYALSRKKDIHLWFADLKKEMDFDSREEAEGARKLVERAGWELSTHGYQILKKELETSDKKTGSEGDS